MSGTEDCHSQNYLICRMDSNTPSAYIKALRLRRDAFSSQKVNIFSTNERRSRSRNDGDAPLAPTRPSRKKRFSACWLIRVCSERPIYLRFARQTGERKLIYSVSMCLFISSNRTIRQKAGAPVNWNQFAAFSNCQIANALIETTSWCAYDPKCQKYKLVSFFWTNICLLFG